jgi:hypothetical protein
MPLLVRALGCALAALATVPSFSAAQSTKIVRYADRQVTVPARWPVVRLTAASKVCVRFDRGAVYLGRPSPEQRCPATAIGRPHAILIEPSGGVFRHPPTPRPEAISAAVRTANTRAAAASAVFTGLGFDVCSAPSTSQMQAWSKSPYRAIGVYLGGANSACAQPNLTATWVSQMATSGWTLIPTYVGLQAPTNSCGCAAINAKQATAEGTAAANDAITQAQAIGLGRGTPIYDDMEAYSRNSTNTSAVLKFLAAWTTQLHASGYVSGIYSSSESGIADLAAQWGTTFVEPDDLWIANWNGVQSTADPNVPTADWPNHHRIHQYSGGHNETYGHVTLNIDGDYVDGATARGPVIPAAAPTLSVSPMPTGSVQLQARWPGESGVAAWQVLAGNSASVLPFGSPVAGGSSTVITVHSQFGFYAVQALGSSGQVLGVSTTAVTPAHIAVYGRAAFVTSTGLGAIPVACYQTTGCSLITTVTAGRTVIATTGPERAAGGRARLVFFRLTGSGRHLLATAPGRRLAVTVRVSGDGFPAVSTSFNLVPYTTAGRGPARSLTNAPSLQTIGATVFAYRGRSAALFAGCLAAAPCVVTATLRSGRTLVAQSTAETLGVDAFGYIGFRLTPAGRALIASSRTNEVAARATLSDGTATATGRIVLVSYR